VGGLEVAWEDGGFRPAASRLGGGGVALDEDAEGDGVVTSAGGMNSSFSLLSYMEMSSMEARCSLFLCASEGLYAKFSRDKIEFELEFDVADEAVAMPECACIVFNRLFRWMELDSDEERTS